MTKKITITIEVSPANRAEYDHLIRRIEGYVEHGTFRDGLCSAEVDADHVRVDYEPEDGLD